MSEIHKVILTPKQAENFQELLMENSGLIIEDRRIKDLERAIAGRMISLGIFSFEEYYDTLRKHPSSGEELAQLILSVTVGETHFFRTPSQFKALRTCIVPDLLKRKMDGKRLLRFFSAGCSTGEEPYSIVISMMEAFPGLEGWEVEVLACDINREYLAKAKEGLYPKSKLKLVSPELREKYFHQRGAKYEVSEEIKKRVKFINFNLTENNYHFLNKDGGFDVIFCRNVLIYFKDNYVRHAVRKLSDILNEDGYLMLGYSETLYNVSDEFKSIHTDETFFFHKAADIEKKSARERRPWSEIKVSLPERPLARKDWLDIIGSSPYQGPRIKSAENGLALQEQTVAEQAETEEELWGRGMSLFSEESFEMARNVFESIIADNPDSSRGNLGLALMKANSGEDQEAYSLCEKAQEQDALIPEIYLLRALLEEKNSNPMEAVRNYQCVLWLDPQYVIAYFNLGNLYLSINRERDAKIQFQNALTLLENDKGNHFSLFFSGGLSRDALKQICLTQLNLKSRRVERSL